MSNRVKMCIVLMACDSESVVCIYEPFMYEHIHGMHSCACMCVCMHVEAKGQHQLPFTITLHIFILKLVLICLLILWGGA